MRLRVAVTDPDRWPNALADMAADLLHWLTGDQWTLTLLKDASGNGPESSPATNPKGAPISLLSGGLDSFLGALYLLQPGHTQPQFLGHADSAAAVRHAQSAAGPVAWHRLQPAALLLAIGFQPGRTQDRELQPQQITAFHEKLGSAAAAATHSDTVYVPENGFTSLNVPLHPNRGGALSTRSTHPTTLQRVNGLLAALDLTVQITNPFADLTKGEQMLLESRRRHRQQGGRSLPPRLSRAASWTAGLSKAVTRTLTAGFAIPVLFDAEPFWPRVSRTRPSTSPMH